MIYTYQYQNQTYTVQLEPLPGGRYRVTVSGGTRENESRVVDVSTLANGGVLLEIDGKKIPAYSASAGNERFVKVGDHSTKTLIVEDQRTRRRAGKAGGEAHLTAQMPGQVVDVLIQVGERVESGQTLVILEAMKMEIRVSAPHDGVISQLFVQKGDVVERGQQLLDIDSKNKEE